MMENGMGFGMGFGWVWMLLLLVGFVALVVWLVRLMFPQNSSSTSEVERESALDIAQRRYAEGEISREEYESLKRDLT